MKIILALAVMLSINMFLFLGQVSVENVATSELSTNPASTLLTSGNFGYIDSYNQGTDGQYVGNNNISLPDTEGGISPDTGNFFVDPIGSLKGFFKTAGKGLNYAHKIVTAVPNFLNSIGLPSEVAFALGFFWNGLTGFLLVMLIWGRQV